MGTITPQTNADSNRLWERVATRTAILAAARRVAELDGVVDMSLTSVAKEAGFAPTSVYAYFTSKNDLLLAVIADDLATLAQAMRGSFDCHDNDEIGELMSNIPDPLPAGIALLPAGREPIPTGAPLSFDARQPSSGTSQEVVASDAMQVSYGDSILAASPRTDLPRRIPTVEVNRDKSVARDMSGAVDTLARLQETVARLETRPVDAWLERRLREFERSLASLEGRNIERNTTNDSVDDRLRVLGQNLADLEARLGAVGENVERSLGQRLDLSEKRLRELVSTLQSDAGRLDKRLTPLENAVFAAKPEFFEPTVAPALPEAAPAVPDAKMPESGAPATVVAPTQGAASSYLDAARRSAQDAAHAQEQRTPRAPQRKSRRLYYAAGGSLLVFVALLAGSGLVLRDQAMHVTPVHSPVGPGRPRPLHRSLPAKTVAGAPNDAMSHLRTLAESGDASAELLIGLDYLDGNGVPKSDASSFAWLARAAAKGQPLAEYQLGVFYQNGRGVHPDPVQAFQWFGSAALRGNRRAMHSLATSYAEGWGTTKNLPEAARWFERAAALGSANSQFNLGVLYERGMGVPQSLSDAYKWYAIAGAQGDSESQARVAALASTLTPGDLSAARAAAALFKPDTIDISANIPPKSVPLP